MKLNLDQIEARLQAFVENRLMFFPWARRQNALAQLVVAAMQENLATGPGGVLTAPNNYVLSIHPQNLAAWQSSPDVLTTLADVLTTAVREAGLTFAAPPVIRLAADPAVPLDEMRVTATILGANGEGTTAVLPALTAPEEPPADSCPANAFLIVNGAETYPLRQPVINIGRRLDNHVIVNDPRVSRAHAQIRAVRGRYILFDLNSSGGTFVNGQPVHQQTLKPGDVISLAGVPMIYGEDTPPKDSDTTAFYPER